MFDSANQKRLPLPPSDVINTSPRMAAEVIYGRSLLGSLTSVSVHRLPLNFAQVPTSMYIIPTQIFKRLQAF